MKKILITFVVLLLLFSATVFVMIPNHIEIRASGTVATTGNRFDSAFHHYTAWKKWWPGSTNSDALFSLGNTSYKLLTPYTDGGDVGISGNAGSFISRIQTISRGRDSIAAEWSVAVPTTMNPFNRLSNYFAAGRLKQEMQVIMDSLCSFAGRTENVYGFPIERTTFTEVTLLAGRFTTPEPPSTSLIYEAISRLRAYLEKEGAVEKYYPMINTRSLENGGYETMAAISIDKAIKGNNEFFITQMVPMKDRFLATEVKGGPARVIKAHEAIEEYMRDRSLSAPARPFEILVTERNNEPDTSKWVTKIFYPSM